MRTWVKALLISSILVTATSAYAQTAATGDTQGAGAPAADGNSGGINVPPADSNGGLNTPPADSNGGLNVPPPPSDSGGGINTSPSSSMEPPGETTPEASNEMPFPKEAATGDVPAEPPAGSDPRALLDKVKNLPQDQAVSVIMTDRWNNATPEEQAKMRGEYISRIDMGYPNATPAQRQKIVEAWEKKYPWMSSYFSKGPTTMPTTEELKETREEIQESRQPDDTGPVNQLGSPDLSKIVGANNAR